MRISKDKKFLLRLLRKTRILRYCNLYPKVELNGKIIRLPILGGVGFENIYPAELWFDRMLKLLFDLREGAFIDIGVNIGQTLIKFLEHGDGREYYGFEPNNLCAAYAEELREINKLQSVHIIPIGLSDHNSLAELFLSSDYDGSASMIDGFRPPEFYTKSQYISVFRGDEVLDILKIGPVCAMKIDVEGAELEVLTGLRNSVAAFNPFIICELLPVYDETSPNGKFRRARVDRVLEFLRTMQYEIFRLSDDGAIWLETIDTHSNLELCNYLFTPKDLRGPVQEQLSA